MADNENELRETALQEVMKAKNELGKNWITFFNNFHMYLNQDSFIWTKGILVNEIDQLDKDPSHSELRQTQTPREFMNAIQEAIFKEGISSQKIAELMDDRDKLFEDGRINELYELLIPVYIRLRSMGYNHQDIQG